MNKELIEMARQAGFARYMTDGEINWKMYGTFADLVRADEREKVATHWEQLHGFDKHAVAAFIRARGEQNE